MRDERQRMEPGAYSYLGGKGGREVEKVVMEAE